MVEVITEEISGNQKIIKAGTSTNSGNPMIHMHLKNTICTDLYNNIRIALCK